LPDAANNRILVTPFEFNDFSPDSERTAGNIEDFRWSVIEARPVRVKKDKSKEQEKLRSEKSNKEGEREELFEERPEKNRQDAHEAERDEAKKIIRDSERYADTILENARDEAASIKEAALEEAKVIKWAAQKEGEKLGFEHGAQTGREEAHAVAQEEMNEILQSRLEDIKAAIESIEDEKAFLLERKTGELRDLALAVAEKVIKISLRSSAGIIEKMIVAATERITGKQWVKISISGVDAKLLHEAGKDVADILGSVSDRVQVEVVEDAAEGLCLIELPDQVIDLSVETQMDNVRELLS